MSHPWHNIPFSPDNKPHILNVYIEISSGSKIKYELDKDSGILRVDRILSSSSVYPANYGFVPKTLGEDKDPLDAIVFSQSTFMPSSFVRAKPIGVLRMVDQGENDEKILCVALDDPWYRDLKSLDELPQHELKEVRQFFMDYKKLENKMVEVLGFEDVEFGEKIILESVERYKKMMREKESKKDME
uniref:Inorganic pyrophosphatase n=1 Tax=Percolomonas cosmopolitus TaxID=63605 RepID=A0A7S1KQW0_9EUKA|mmetsp:Transcript_5329/g.19927  ORF Transcript_5329/g.19927 Transcript_5329/m.19927 type:complete len:187 (+) Transcript_5329:122-682(+)|eukprot:CAMPEP_0117443442 /NCGR_PEP_ID=MMETSP0759-20121206/4696_1 /TAXON_ID=63605 /ORGANISM="Percolomonas cosmopolitus, Strain WS" /LENGTH=186 /DNA_ID=CAMNT_0005235415 /DNA_START=1087 /DNA_END=1647 /DNA_ORIENTATION=-